MPATDTVLSILRAGSRNYGDAVAIRYVDPAELEFNEAATPQVMTYRRLLAQVTALANAFRALSGKARPVVSLLIPSTIDGVVALLAAEVAGRANPINHYLSAPEIRQCMRTAGTDLAVAFGARSHFLLWEKLTAAAEGLDLRAMISTDRGRAPDEAYSLRELVTRYPCENLAEAEPEASDGAALFQTAGTTGRPKIVPLTHRNLLAAAGGLADLWQLDRSDRIVNALPFFHVAGANLLLIAPLSRGAQVQLYSEAGLRNPQVLAHHWKMVEHSRPTIIGGIPSSLIALLDVSLDGADISSVRFCATGGAPLPAVAATQFERQFGLPVHTIYGMTECAGLIAAAPVGLKPDYTTVGRLAAGTELQLRRIGEGWPEITTGTGILCVKGPQVFASYLGEEPSTLLREGWLATGDVGSLGPCEEVFVSGRSKDIIIRSGNNIDPAVIETAAASYPSVATSAAVAMPDRYAGEVPALFVSPRRDYALMVDELSTHLRQALAEPHALPAHIFVLEELPLTRVGKVSRIELRRLAAEHAVRLAAPGADAMLQTDDNGMLVVAVSPAQKEAIAAIQALGLRVVEPSTPRL